MEFSGSLEKKYRVRITGTNDGSQEGISGLYHRPESGVDCHEENGAG